MLKITFGAVKVNDRFFCDGEWYIKVDPKVTGHVIFNAVLEADQARMFWFHNTDIVEQ